MCETMGWEADDVEESVEMMQRTEDGRISLTHFVSWYTDDGMVRVLMSFYAVFYRFLRSFSIVLCCFFYRFMLFLC